jgi:hypothetical protein
VGHVTKLIHGNLKRRLACFEPFIVTIDCVSVPLKMLQSPLAIRSVFKFSPVFAAEGVEVGILEKKTLKTVFC